MIDVEWHTEKQLDSSYQVEIEVNSNDRSGLLMDILKEISKDRLVIMVTHNPELAEQYATRTVRMLDGEIKSDSAPFDDIPVIEEKIGKQKKKKDKTILF